MLMDSRAREVQAYLQEVGLEPLNFEQRTSTSVAAALAIGCSVGEIAKSILMLVGNQPVMVITSGDTRVKSSRLKQAAELTGKVKLPAADEVLLYTGYMPGGVSPFLLPDDLPVFLDNSLQRFTTVYPAAATNSSGVAMSFSRLEELCGGQVVDVCDVLELTD
jgi:prolyl-tRNA editing enzyme YbaK/EbsC (Cys-tRNA(Pro) deacylase)